MDGIDQPCLVPGAHDGASFARAIGLLPRQGSGAEKSMTAAFNALTKMRRAFGF